MPKSELAVESPFGILSNLPFVWLALAVPLGWRGRSMPDAACLRWFVLAVAVLAGVAAVTLCLFAAACVRYQVDFVPAMILLAACGVLGLERALADKPGWRKVARCGWLAALLFSVTVNLLMSIEHYEVEQCRNGMGQLHLGRPQQAIVYFEEALRLRPDDATTHFYFAQALLQTGRAAEAVRHYEQALRLDPGYPGAGRGLAQAEQELQRQGIGLPR